MPTVAETTTAAMMAGTESWVGQWRRVVTRIELPRPRTMPMSAAEQAQHDRLDEELPQDVAGAGADGHAQADLARALGHARRA